MNKLVSVIVPVYNASKTIEETIKSVMNQNYTNFEVIAIDDCSEDNSFELLTKLSKKDIRIKVYKNLKNLGVSETRNLGIDIARGELISFLDSDDIWKKEKLYKQVKYMEEKNVDMCYTSYDMIDTDKIEVKTIIVPEKVNYISLLKENIICCSTVMMNKEILRKYKFESEFFHEDFILWLHLLKNSYKVVGLTDNLVFYRKGGRSSDKLKAARNRWIIYRKSEKLNLILSAYYFICYAFNGIKKYFIK